jgi:very-short-patch-repair endonuclease
MSSALLNKKFEHWEHQLLDLGKRNRMINYRETKRSTLKLVEPSFEELYRKLAIEEETLTFQRVVDRETDVRVFSILSLLENLSVPLPVAIGDIKTEGSILERQKTLKNLRQKARLSLEEQGVNALYISFGFIEWQDGKGSTAQLRKAPLVLVPTTLTLETLNSPYAISKYEDDIVVNPTLQHYLKTEFGIDLPNYDSDKDSLSNYFETLEEIAKQQGWRILKEVSLGLLSFLKIAMYNDLKQNENRIKNNPVIRALSGDVNKVNKVPDKLRTFDLDAIKPTDCYQVMNADSSQQDAILYSKNNISFVMQGPPGTGKSQTITNIIAEALADKKKILFVSEKMAALQVVYRRLQEAHLADFCLPLHSHKAKKREVIELITANLDLKQISVKDHALSNLEELQTIREQLNQYVEELHKVIPKINLSCYDLYSKLKEVNGAPFIVFDLEKPLNVTQSQLRTYLDRIKNYEYAAQRINCNFHNHPWQGLHSYSTEYQYAETIQQKLSSSQNMIDAILTHLEEIKECPELPSTLKYRDIPNLTQFIDLVYELPKIPNHWLDEKNLALLPEEVQALRTRYQKLTAFENKIAEVFNSGIYTFDYNGWKEKILSVANEFLAMPYIKKDSPDFFIAYQSPLYKIFSSLREALVQAISAVNSINKLLGVDVSVNIVELQKIDQLLKLIKKNDIIPKNWFAINLNKHEELLKEARSKATQLHKIKNRILEKWEPDALQLDYAPMLLRYKTDHTSFFKIFKSQYRKDVKTIKGLSRKIVSNYGDEIAADLLFTLKDYHDQVAWFEENRAALSDSLDSYYNGIDSQWDEALSANHTAQKLKFQCEEILSETLLDLLAKNHNEVVSSLETLLETARTAVNQINDNEAPLSVDAEFDAQEALANVEVYLTRLNLVKEQAYELKPYLMDNKTDIRSVYKTISYLNAHRQLSKELDDDAETNAQRFGEFFENRQTDWNNILSLLRQTSHILENRTHGFLDALINVDVSRKQEIKKIADEISKLYHQAGTTLQWISSQLTQSQFNQDARLAAISQEVKNYIEALPMLDDWIAYQEAKKECCADNLQDFIKKIEATGRCNEIEKIFLKRYYTLCLGAACDEFASVRRFGRNTHDERIKRFIELDNFQLATAQMRIREMLIDKLPSAHQLLRATDEVAILKKELNKKRNVMPLRRLFRLIPNLLLTLKPCLMMSPLSVSHFLDAEAYHFDLVIFDEASQIFPEDAIGAIFRGSQVVIAGDSKQLPPTNFFRASANNFDSEYDGSDEDDEDLYYDVVSDSILEEAAAALPNRSLLWHYRSKHENLIAFSNREMYGNKLITFPNSLANVPNMGVEYVYVEDGYYEGGGKNCNIKEAQKCLELLLEHIQERPDRSLGIIAFSEKQQAVIENVILDFRKQNPQYEWFFDEAKEEPFFVKNLENVQGDERDVVFFSIGYAKDQQGKMYMRFGPLSHEGGERRLNVAITRAKCNVKLIGSILPSDVDLNRTNSQGVQMLRSYIEFAQQGASALRPTDKEKTFDTTDDFCKIIVAFLEKNGYKVHTEVGCSDYKIDIAVVNPKADGEYIAGIECDGPAYFQAKTARDRDNLRSTILQNMGWNLYRVWSTEWARKPETERQALLNYLRSVVGKDGRIKRNVKYSNEETAAIPVEQIATESVQSQLESATNPYDFTYYVETDWQQAPSSNSINEVERVIQLILYVVSAEQPIHTDLLYERVRPSITGVKAKQRVKNYIKQAITLKLKGQVKIDDEQFVRLSPEKPVVARIPRPYDIPRPIEYIHREEIAAAMLRIVEHSFGITTDNLSAECTRAFGFERRGPKIKTKMDDAMDFLIKTKKIKIINDKVQIVNNK